MHMHSKSTVVLITGASKEIAKVIAMSMAEKGYNLHLVSHMCNDLKETKLEITNRYGVKVSIHDIDLSNSNNILELIKTIGAPDVLINNPAVISVGKYADTENSITVATWEKAVLDYLIMCRTFYASMKARGTGLIINVTGLLSDGTLGDYISGRFGNTGLNNFTKKWGSDSLKDGIRIFSVNAGAENVERMDISMLVLAEPEHENIDQLRSFLTSLPVGQAIPIKECVETVISIVSGRDAYISGTVIKAGRRSGS